MKSFKHNAPASSGPDLQTESINGKRYYVTPNGEKYPSITTVLNDRGKEGNSRARGQTKRVNERNKNVKNRSTQINTWTKDF